MNKSLENKHVRRGFGLKNEVTDTVLNTYSGNLVETIRDSNNVMTIGKTSIKLAKEFGFCYGVDRAIDYTYETLYKFPDKTIYLTGEMIHNPQVNKNLAEKGIRFLSGSFQKGETIEDIKKEDVVILPAFGVSVDMLAKLKSLDCILVDTTCGSVINVWKNVKKFSREGLTTIVHGKSYHEETMATVSYAENKKYLVVRDVEETQKVIDYILNPGDKDIFLNYFKNALSPAFNPDVDLIKIGVANQTTMLAGESLQVAEMLKKALIQKYGDNSIDKHFQSFDTICSATQDRQDAIIELLETSPDLTIVIGGFNSSNTMNLANIATKYGPAYHITDAACLEKDFIRHQPAGKKESKIGQNWLPDKKLTIAVTAGASTPNNIISEVIEKIFQFRGEEIQK